MYFLNETKRFKKRNRKGREGSVCVRPNELSQFGDWGLGTFQRILSQALVQHLAKLLNGIGLCGQLFF